MSTHARGNDDLLFRPIALEWLNPQPGLDVETWAPAMVARARAAGVETLAFDFWHGGYSVYDGSLAPKDEHVGDQDLLAAVSVEVERHGMKLVLMNMGGHCNSYVCEEHPSWQVRDSAGEPRPGVQSNFLCLNSPYGDFMIDEFRRVLQRYSCAGLYIEGLYSLLCYCDYCRTEYRRTFDADIPSDEETAGRNSQVRHFRAQVLTRFVRRVANLLREIAPDTQLIACPSWFEEANCDFEAWGDLVDVIALERQWGFNRFKVPLLEIGFSLDMARALARRPSIGTLWSAWGVDRNYAVCPDPHYRLNFMEILLHGSTPQLHVQTLFEVDQSSVPVVTEMFEFLARMRPQLARDKAPSSVALVVDWREYESSDHVRGFYAALAEGHVQFDLVPQSALSGDLGGYRCLVLPNIVHLADEAIDAVIEFASNGGGVVVTYDTGSRRPDGSVRAENPLHAAVGVTAPYGRRTNPSLISDDDNPLRFLPEVKFQMLPQTYYRHVGSEMTGLASFQGSHLVVDAVDAEVVARTLTYDFSRMHRHHPVHGWYPGSDSDPLVVRRHVNSGRVSFVTGEVDRDFHLTGQLTARELLIDEVRWVAGGFDLVTNAPATVEVSARAYADGTGGLILLMNKATNHLPPGFVVREVAPTSRLTFEVRVPNPPAQVASALGVPLEWSYADGWLAIELAALVEYDAITFGDAVGDPA